jgi:hypothetical protein
MILSQQRLLQLPLDMRASQRVLGKPAIPASQTVQPFDRARSGGSLCQMGDRRDSGLPGESPR